MKLRNLGITAAIPLALLFTSLSTPAGAEENLLTASRQSSASEEVFDAKEQAKQGIAAYNRGDYTEAFRLLNSVSILGGAEVHYRLGLMYAEGLGTRKSARLAAYWLKLAARQNHAGATEALTTLQQSGAIG